MRFLPVLPRLSRIALLILGSLLLEGCLNTDLPPEIVKTAPVNFNESYDGMAFKLLPVDKKVRLAINEFDPNFRFEGGFSRYESLALPDLAQPYKLRIESEVVRKSIYGNGTVFFPVLTFLDANKKWIKTFDKLPYVTQKPYSGRNYILVYLQMSDELVAARYLVIHTQEDKFNMAIGSHDGQTLLQSSGYEQMMFAPSTKPRYRYNFVPEGWVRIKAFTPPEVDKAPPKEY
jgi:hypothetical protein